jgi:hypothetical protein
MKRKLSILTLALLAVLAVQSTAMAADEAEYKTALASTRETLRDAATRVQLWTTSDTLLQSAAEAAETGDYDLAIRLLEEAELHVQLALATAEREKKTWQNSVPKTDQP